MSLSNDKRKQSIDLLETHTYGMSKKEKIKVNNIIKEYKID